MPRVVCDDMGGDDMKTLDECIASVEREIRMRHKVYGNKLRWGAMDEDEARHEIECMEQVLTFLRTHVQPELGLTHENTD